MAISIIVQRQVEGDWLPLTVTPAKSRGDASAAAWLAATTLPPDSRVLLADSSANTLTLYRPDGSAEPLAQDVQTELAL